jgi:hypothetical protein
MAEHCSLVPLLQKAPLAKAPVLTEDQALEAAVHENTLAAPWVSSVGGCFSYHLQCASAEGSGDGDDGSSGDLHVHYDDDQLLALWHRIDSCFCHRA